MALVMGMADTRRVRGLLRAWGVVTCAVVMQGCMIAAPVVISHLKGPKYHTATVQVNEKADKVYHAAIRLLEQNPQIALLKRDDPNRMVEATDGDRVAEIKATAIDTNKTELIVTADAGKSGQTHEELALLVVERICDQLGVAWKLVE